MRPIRDELTAVAEYLEGTCEISAAKTCRKAVEELEQLEAEIRRRDREDIDSKIERDYAE